MQHDIDDDEDNFEIVNGKRVLRDGGRMSVKMLMMDSGEEVLRNTTEHMQVQRRISARDAAEKRFADHLGLKDAASLHRPGWRFNNDAIADEKAALSYAIHDGGDETAWRGDKKVAASDEVLSREEAYRAYQVDAENAWRSPPTGAGSSAPRGAQPGDSCTLDGRAGRLRLINGELQCVPDGPVRGSDHAMTDREAAHAEYRTRIENAWRYGR